MGVPYLGLPEGNFGKRFKQDRPLYCRSGPASAALVCNAEMVRGGFKV